MWSARLDGAVYGQPLVIGKTVVAATQGNSVYGLARETGKILWHTKVGNPVPRSLLPCGHINPLGITSTPVYDPSTGTVFVVAETSDFRHVFIGLSAKDGSVQVRRDIAPPDATPRNELQRAALTLFRGRVYVAFGGLADDCGLYSGSVIGVPISGQGDLLTWKVPTQQKGGISATGGPTVGDDGNIYVSVGAGVPTSPRFDGSNSITALTPDLKVQSQFTPVTWASDNASGLDLGSMSPALMEDRVLALGKRGIGYLLHTSDLRGVGGEITHAHVCAAAGGPSVSGNTAYVPCRDGTAAVATVGDQIKVLWRGPRGTNGSPVVAGAMVWTTGPNTLYALDQGTGKIHDDIDVGPLPPYASPTLSGGLILLGTLQGVTAISSA